MKILLVEDEAKTGEYLRQGLAEAGYTTDWVQDGLSGRHQALSGEYDLIVLDVMLPELNGWQVLAGIRRAGLMMPVLFLTARDQVEDRVKGLELGADDYLVKPFAFAELLARCAPCCGAAARVSRTRCAWPIWNWTCCAAAPNAAIAASTSPPRSSRCWNC